MKLIPPVVVVRRSMKKFSSYAQKGFSLMEVLIFITVLSVIFLAIAYATSQSIKQTKFNEQKLLATRYAEELEEWFRGEKESDWATFYGTRAGAGGRTYCFSDSTYDGSGNLIWPTTGNCGLSYDLRSLYKREATLTQSLGSQVQVVIRVDWRDGPNIFTVPITTILSKWE